VPDVKGENWVECSKELIDGKINADYFKAGNTILAGINYNFPPTGSVGHWIVIVKEKQVTLEIAGKDYHLYPTDDPLWGAVYVMAPLLAPEAIKSLKKYPNLHSDKGLKAEDSLIYAGRDVHMLVKGNAYMRKQGL